MCIRDSTSILSGLALGIGEVGGDCDDGLGDCCAQIGLGIRLQLLQDHGADLLAVSYTHLGLLLGHEIEGIAKELGGYGADGVYVCDHPLLANYTTDGYTKVICDVIQELSLIHI